jgi:hypothetical protein
MKEWTSKPEEILDTYFVAELMASLPGMPGYRICTIEHPASSAGDSELESCTED